MIFDTLAHAAQYDALGPRIAAGLKFLRENDLSALPAGRRDLDGANLYALVQDYETRLPEACFWEAHRKYIDIQCVVRGTERFGYAPIERLAAAAPYDESKDFLKLTGEGHILVFPAGTFMLLYPHDAHMPGLFLDRPQPVRKVVVKVKLQSL